MKRILLAVLINLLIGAPALALTVKPGDTPFGIWGKSWPTELAKYGISDPKKLPVGLEITSHAGEEMLGAINYAQTQPFYLYGSGAILGATTVVLRSFKAIDGSTLLTMNNFGEKGWATIDPGAGTQEEQISFTGVTQNANGTATLTGVKTVLFVAPYTETSGLAKTHTGGTRLVISNTVGFYSTFANKYNNENVTGYWTFPSPLSSSSSAPATVSYVNGLVASGVATSSESNFGGVWLATQVNMASSSYDVNSPRVLYSRYATSSPYTAGLWVPITQNNGKLSQSFLDLTQNFSWSGQHNFTASTSLNYFSFSTGTTNQYNITALPTPTSYNQGDVYRFFASASSTSSSTLNVNGLGAKFIKRNGLNTGYGDIGKNQITTVIYDGTNFQLDSPAPTFPNSLVPLPSTRIVTTTAADTYSANEARYMLVDIPYDFEFRQISLYISAFSTSATTTFAIYTADGGTRIYSTTTPVITGTGLKQFPLPAGTSVKLPKGQYYFGYAQARVGTAFTPLQWQTSQDMMNFSDGGASNIDFVGMVANGAPLGVLPASFNATNLTTDPVFPVIRLDY